MSNNRPIIIEHYPASLLPEELRQGIPEDQKVRVTVETEGANRENEARDLKSFVGSAMGVYPDPDTAKSILRHLRDEWE